MQCKPCIWKSARLGTQLQDGQTRLSDLPPALAVEIARLLPREAKRNMRLVNKEWRANVDQAIAKTYVPSLQNFNEQVVRFPGLQEDDFLVMDPISRVHPFNR